MEGVVTERNINNIIVSTEILCTYNDNNGRVPSIFRKKGWEEIENFEYMIITTIINVNKCI